MKGNQLLNILHFQHDVALKCICKFSNFKYYSKIHQTSNGEVGLNSIFKHTCYIVPKLFKFVITSLYIQRKAPWFYYIISNYFQSTFFYLCKKLDHFLIVLEITTFFYTLPCFHLYASK
jgi:hypothetical protein